MSHSTCSKVGEIRFKANPDVTHTEQSSLTSNKGVEDLVNNNPVWNQIQGNWKQFAGSVRQQWGKLTDDDLMQINGSRERLAGKLQERYGITQQEANNQIDAWAQKLKF